MGGFRLPDEKALRELQERLKPTRTIRRFADEEEKEKPSKYKNKKVVVDGIKFPSKKEGARWLELKQLEASGLIQNLERQVVFVLIPAQIISGRHHRSIKYIADFVYIEGGLKVVEDPKGYRNRIYQLKRRLMKHVHNIEILET